MRAWRLTGLALAAAMLVAAGGDSPDLVLRPDFTLSAIVRGKPARLRIDPGAPSIPVFNPDFAERAGFKGGMVGTSARVGPVVRRGKSAVVRIDLGGGIFKRRVTWFWAPFVEGADGAVGPGGLPAPVVRFDLRAPQPGEQSVALPLADFAWSGMGVVVPVGGLPISIYFSLDRAHSIATASGGATIAAANGGAFDRPAQQMVIELAVRRPVRHMTLAEPLRIGPLAIGDMLVRTADFGSTAGIRDASARSDPDEIVVVGQKRQTRQLRLEIGRDYLDRCSSIVFDKPRRLITLSCR